MPNLNIRTSRFYIHFFLILFTISLLFIPNTNVFSQMNTQFTQLPSILSELPQQEAPISLVVNNILIGDIIARIENDDPYLPISDLKTYLAETLSEESKKLVFSFVLLKLEWAGIQELKAAGITGLWNPETLRYFINVPINMASMTELDFIPRYDSHISFGLGRANISSVINLNATADINFYDTIINYPAYFSMDGVINLFGLALETKANISLNEGISQTNFEKYRAIFDVPAWESRITAGRISAKGMSFQATPEIFGISLATADVFSKYDRIESPSIFFILDKASVIRVVINGATLKVVRLAPGKYRFFDLPFLFGLNSFSLEILDENGGFAEYKPIKTYISTESSLLVGNKTDYGLSAGIDTESTNPYFSGFYRYGLTYDLSLSFFGQININSILYGSSLVWGSQIGAFNAEIAAISAWDNRSSPFTYAGSLKYNLVIPSKPLIPAINLSTTFKSTNFSTPLPSAFFTPKDAILSSVIQVGGNLGTSTSMGISGLWTRIFSTSLNDTTSILLNFSQLLKKINANFSVTTGVNFSSLSPPSWDLSATFMIVDPKRQGRRLSIMQTATGDNSLDFSDKFNVLDGLDFNLQGRNISGSTTSSSGVSSSVRKNTKIGDFSIRGEANWGGSTDVFYGGIKAAASTGIVFADGQIALSKPINDSFVLFVPDKTAKTETYLFKLDSGGQVESKGTPSAIPLSSYQTVNASVDFPEMNGDFSATVPRIKLSPSYRSGILYRSGVSKSFIASGTLLDTKDKPVRYVAGEIYDSTETLITSTFTDENGMFMFYSLTPGDFIIKWSAGYDEIHFNIKSTHEDIVEIGSFIVLQVEK